MEENLKRVYLVRWWKSQGILTGDLRIVRGSVEPDEYATTSGTELKSYVFEREFYFTEEEAQEAVRKKRLKKLASLEKQIEKLRAELDKPVKVKELDK